MKKKEIIISITIVIIIAIIILVININKINLKKDENTNSQNNIFAINNIYTEIDKNQISYKEDANIEELKQDAGKSGNTDIYEVQTEYDGRKTLRIKASLKYKVAFVGLVKNSKPDFSNIDDIYEKNIPQNAGIWIEKNSRAKVLSYFNNIELFNSKYEIDNNGYLKIINENNPNDNDKKIKNILNGKKQYILDVSSICYIVDDITGEILDYNFEKMDKYQTYEYFEDDDKMIIFINENTSKQMTDKEIFTSIIDLI